MCAVARKIEATLFYHSDPELVFKQLSQDLVNAFHTTSVALYPRLVTQTDLGCIIGGLTLTLLRHPEPVATPPLPHEASTQTRSTAFTLRISGPEDAAQTSTRLALCYVAVMQILNRARADRIHWGYTNVIHTTDTFLLESSGRHMKPNGARGLQRPRKLGPTVQKDLFSTRDRAPQAKTTHQTTDQTAHQTTHQTSPCSLAQKQPEGMSTRVYEKWCTPASSEVSDRLSQFLAGFRT